MGHSVGLHHKQPVCTAHVYTLTDIRMCRQPVSCKRRQPTKWAPTVLCVSAPAMPPACAQNTGNVAASVPVCMLLAAHVHVKNSPRAHTPCLCEGKSPQHCSPVHHIAQGTDEGDTRDPARPIFCSTVTCGSFLAGVLRVCTYSAASCPQLRWFAAPGYQTHHTHALSGVKRVPGNPTRANIVSRLEQAAVHSLLHTQKDRAAPSDDLQCTASHSTSCLKP